MGKSITDLSSVTTVVLDLAKHVFQVHATGAFGRVIVAKALQRKVVLAFFAELPECLVGMEACGQTLCASAKERRGRRRRDLRSGDKAFDALCRRAHTGEPGGAHASQSARNAGGATHAAIEPSPRWLEATKWRAA